MVLSDEEVTRIEARADAATKPPWEQRFVGAAGFTVWASAITRTGSMQVAAFGHAEGFDKDNAEFAAHAREDIPALCRSLRQAWGENEALRTDLRQGETCEKCEQETNDEQGNPLTFLVCGRCWNKREEEVKTLREQLARCEGSRRVHELDNHHNALACGYCNGPLKDGLTQLQSELAQSRAENERLASQLKEWQEEKDTKAGYL